jgi:multidrug resistance protein
MGNSKIGHGHADAADLDPISECQLPSTLDIDKIKVINDEKQDSRPSTATSTALTFLDHQSPITYHYLTFETPLPLPSPPPLNVDTPPPPAPDLSSFGDPFLWSPTRKRLTIWLACLATMFTAYNAGSYSPPLAAMSAEFGVSELTALTGLTSFCLGFAITPMVLAPFSEIQGRYPVFVVAGILFEAMQIACALTPNVAGMIVARFLVGCGSSVFSSMVGGVISDLYHTHERNTSMALFSGAALFGTGLGPLVASLLAQNLQWRWVFWVQTITNGFLILAVIVFLKESRGSVLLSRRAAALNTWYEEREKAGYVGFAMPDPSGSGIVSQRIRWKVKSDEERESLTKMIKISVWRPLRKTSCLCYAALVDII